MYGIDMWGLDGGWEESDKIYSRVCKIILGIPRFAEKNMAELELGRNSRRGKVLSTIAKYWFLFLRMGSLEIERACYEWQINNLNVDGWGKKLKDELETVGFAYICQSQSEINVNICKIIRERCNDIERQNIFSDINVKISLIFYCEMKYSYK
jgi:hypothetical protein